MDFTVTFSYVCIMCFCHSHPCYPFHVFVVCVCDLVNFVRLVYRSTCTLVVDTPLRKCFFPHPPLTAHNILRSRNGGALWTLPPPMTGADRSSRVQLLCRQSHLLWAQERSSHGRPQSAFLTSFPPSFRSVSLALEGVISMSHVWLTTQYSFILHAWDQLWASADPADYRERKKLLCPKQTGALSRGHKQSNVEGISCPLRKNNYRHTSPMGPKASPATGSWLDLQHQVWITPMEWTSSPVKKHLIIP